MFGGFRRIGLTPRLLGVIGVLSGFGGCGVATAWLLTSMPATAFASLGAAPRAQRLGASAVARVAASDADLQSIPLSPLDRPAAEQAAPPLDPQTARQVNAAIPLARSPVEPARPFVLQAGGAADRDRALQCLTMAVYYEAGFEPVEGQRAVAQVVLNRVRHPAFPKSVCGVVFQGAQLPVCQFSFTCDGALAHKPAPAAWRRARQVAAEALAGHVERLVGSSTHYHADYVAPWWAPRLYKIRQIGAHIFYRWPGAAGAGASFVGRYAGAEPPPVLLRTFPAVETAEVAAFPPERRADNDVGGRITPGLGWTPTVPVMDPAESAYARTVAGRQNAEKPPAAASEARDAASLS